MGGLWESWHDFMGQVLARLYSMKSLRQENFDPAFNLNLRFSNPPDSLDKLNFSCTIEEQISTCLLFALLCFYLLSQYFSDGGGIHAIKKN